MFIILLGIVMLYPIIWMVASSLKPADEVFRNAASLIPSKLMWQNYVEGWKGFGNVSFATFFKNSFVVTILAVIGQVISSAVVAYGFARIRFPGRKILFAAMILTMLLPAQILLIPQYIMFVGFDWIDTYLPLIIPHYFGTPFFIFLIMQFIQGIPRELDESAKIDGCNNNGFLILLEVGRFYGTVALFAFPNEIHSIYRPEKLLRPVFGHQLERYVCDVDAVSYPEFCDLSLFPALPGGRHFHNGS